MVQTVRLTMDNSQLLITVADVPVARSRSSRVHTWRRQSSSQICTRCGFRRTGQLIIALMSWWSEFLGPCTQVQGRGSCPQGHGLHN